MSGQETELEFVGRTRSGVPERTPETAGSSTHALELSSRAIKDGRFGTLDAPSVVHLQALAGNASVSRVLEDDQAPDKVRSVVGQGGGEPLAPELAETMGARLGADFGDVRIHQGGAAAESARAVNAHAYTVGSHVVFGSGQFDPMSPSGQRTLAHELTHVVQQRAGAVSGTEIGGGLAVSDPSDRYEQDATRTAERLTASADVTSASPPAPAMAAQRHAEDETEIAQRGIAIAQREESPEEEEEAGSGSGLIAQRDESPEEEEEAGSGSGLIAQRDESPEEDEMLAG